MAQAQAHTDFDHGLAWAQFASEAAPELAAFEASLEAPELTQQRVLGSILARNAASEYGRRHRFQSIHSYEEFRKRVPVTRWADVAPWIERSQATLEPVICAETPSFYECTSGSSAARKEIPYTPSLLGEIKRAVVVSLAKLYRECPALAGPSYWALSPATAAPMRAPNGIPIGSLSDAEYVEGSAAARLLPTVLDVRMAAQKTGAWRLETLCRLIATEDLRFVSVWSPTFLTALLEPLLAAPSRGDARAWLERRLEPERRRTLARALGDGELACLWPSLNVISCWTDGPSARYARALASLFPQARLVPKGLFATEGVVSIPWGLSGRCPLAIASHVLEFEDDAAEIHPAHSLVEGRRYRPLLTTGGGLYRYALGDVVEVDGFLGRTPCVRFRGRSDARSDLTGEKLDEPLAAEALAALPNAFAGAWLVPIADARPPGYLLLLEAAERSPAVERSARELGGDALHARAERFAAAVEQRLMNVFHYAQARRAGQLARLGVRLVPEASGLLPRAWESAGGRAGDFKPAALVASLPHAHALLRMLEREAPV